MSFSYLPLPVYLLLMITIAFALFVWILKSWNRESKLSLGGIAVIGIAILGLALNRMGEERNIFESSLGILKWLIQVAAFVGINLVMFSGYKKVKHDPQKKRTALILISAFYLILLLMAIIVIYGLSLR